MKVFFFLVFKNSPYSDSFIYSINIYRVLSKARNFVRHLEYKEYSLPCPRELIIEGKKEIEGVPRWC